MKYVGSKNRIAKHILPLMLNYAQKRDITTWVEPFVGGGNMIDKVPNTFERIGIDYNPHTIEALIAIRDLVDKLPTTMSEEYYKGIKGSEPDPITSWLRFVCAFGGMFESGYARHGNSIKDRSTPVVEGVRNAQKQSPNLQGVKLVHASYEEYSHLKNCLIYCDPPYQGTTKYKVGSFDHEKFWDWCRKMSKCNAVFISEYNAPKDFLCLWEGEIKTNFPSKRKSAKTATEKLFIHNYVHLL